MDGDAPKKKGEGFVRDLLEKWNKLHAVRTVTSAGALAAFLYGLYRR
jgi:uncharacterized membrane protein